MPLLARIRHLKNILKRGSRKLDKKVLKDIQKVLFGAVIYDLIGIVILFIIQKASINTIGGLLAGTIVSILGFLLMAKNVVDLVEKEKVKASLTALGGYSLRLILYAAILIFAAVSKSINIFTVAFGLVSISFVIKIQNLMKKISGRKED